MKLVKCPHCSSKMVVTKAVNEAGLFKMSLVCKSSLIDPKPGTYRCNFWINTEGKSKADCMRKISAGLRWRKKRIAQRTLEDKSLKGISIQLLACAKV